MQNRYTNDALASAYTLSFVGIHIFMLPLFLYSYSTLTFLNVVRTVHFSLTP